MSRSCWLNAGSAPATRPCAAGRSGSGHRSRPNQATRHAAYVCRQMRRDARPLRFAQPEQALAHDHLQESAIRLTHHIVRANQFMSFDPSRERCLLGSQATCQRGAAGARAEGTARTLVFASLLKFFPDPRDPTRSLLAQQILRSELPNRHCEHMFEAPKRALEITTGVESFCESFHAD